MATKKYLDLSGLTQYDTKIKSVIPSKTSDLTNDSGFITDSKVVVIEYGENILYSTVLNYLQNGYAVFCKCHIDVDVQGINDFQYIPAIWESNDYNTITFSSVVYNEEQEIVFRNINLEYQEENGVETYGYWNYYDDDQLVPETNVKYITYGENILWSTVNSYIQNGYDVICIYNNNAQSMYTGTFYLSLFYEKTSQTKPPLNIFRFGSFISDYEKNIIVTLTADYDNNDNEIYGTWAETEFDLQEELVSGTNIKTINNTSLLGSGNINIGGGLTIDDVYPVGSIYMSVNSTNPTTLFGGTWQRIKDTFLLASGDTYANGTTGGSATHTLTIDEMPSHTHIQNAHNHKWLGRKTSWGSSGGNNVLIDNTGSSYSAVSAVANNGIDETTATNQNTGGGQAHNNMPPYLAVYMWQRTA